VPDPFDGFGTIGDRMHDFVMWRDGWVGDVLVLELDCVAVPIATRVFDMTFVGVVVFRGSGEVSTIDRVECPRAPFVRFFVDLYIATHGRQWHFVVAEWSTHMCIG